MDWRSALTIVQLIKETAAQPDMKKLHDKARVKLRELQEEEENEFEEEEDE